MDLVTLTGDSPGVFIILLNACLLVFIIVVVQIYIYIYIELNS